MKIARLRGFGGITVEKTAIKICGLSRPEHALCASRHGAHMLGMVFASSRRQIMPQQARAIVRALDDDGSEALRVGVFVNEAPGQIREISAYVGLDVVQLSGDETPATVAECARFSPVIKALRFPAGTTEQEASARIQEYLSLGLGDRLILLVDAYHPGSYGGSGQAADWLLASRLASSTPILLAGGLTPSNVAASIQAVSPWGVDVSSGVERDGVKDPALIEEFIRAARMAANKG